MSSSYSLTASSKQRPTPHPLGFFLRETDLEKRSTTPDIKERIATIYQHLRARLLPGEGALNNSPRGSLATSDDDLIYWTHVQTDTALGIGQQAQELRDKAFNAWKEHVNDILKETRIYRWNSFDQAQQTAIERIETYLESDRSTTQQEQQILMNTISQIWSPCIGSSKELRDRNGPFNAWKNEIQELLADLLEYQAVLDETNKATIEQATTMLTNDSSETRGEQQKLRETIMNLLEPILPHARFLI